MIGHLEKATVIYTVCIAMLLIIAVYTLTKECS